MNTVTLGKVNGSRKRRERKRERERERERERNSNYIGDGACKVRLRLVN